MLETYRVTYFAGTYIHREFTTTPEKAVAIHNYLKGCFPLQRLISKIAIENNVSLYRHKMSPKITVHVDRFNAGNCIQLKAMIDLVASSNSYYPSARPRSQEARKNSAKVLDEILRITKQVYGFSEVITTNTGIPVRSVLYSRRKGDSRTYIFCHKEGTQLGYLWTQERDWTQPHLEGIAKLLNTHGLVYIWETSETANRVKDIQSPYEIAFRNKMFRNEEEGKIIVDQMQIKQAESLLKFWQLETTSCKPL